MSDFEFGVAGRGVVVAKYTELHLFLRKADGQQMTELDADELAVLFLEAAKLKGYESDFCVALGATSDDLKQIRDYYDENLIEWGDQFPDLKA